MERFKIKIVKTDEINIDDCRFKISDDLKIDYIENSIKEIGLLNPPILIKNGTYSIISGFKRIKACKNIGIQKIKALIIDKKESSDELYKIAISDNSTQRKLSFNEIIKCIRLIYLNIVDETHEYKIQLLNNLLNINENHNDIIKLLKISYMPEKIIDLVNKNRLSVSVAYEISNYTDQVIDILYDIFSIIDISHNSQKELINLIFEISHKFKITPETIFNEVLDFMNDFKGSNSQAYDNVIRFLKKRRYPQLSDFKHHFEEKKNNLLSDKSVSIQILKEFDELTFQVKILFKDAPELFNRCRQIIACENNNEFISLFGY